jgi:hypothetical protein
MYLFDQDRPEVIDVGEGGTGDHGVLERAEETMCIIVVEHVLGLEPQSARTR